MLNGFPSEETLNIIWDSQKVTVSTIPNIDNNLSKNPKLLERLRRSQYQSKIRHRYWDCENEITSYNKYDFGWDGEGSIPINVEVRVNALKFLKEIGSKILLTSEDYIYATGDGTIVIDFENELKDLVSVEVREYSIGFFLQTEGLINRVGDSIDETIQAINFIWERSEKKEI
jgi:hypothetical protein